MIRNIEKLIVVAALAALPISLAADTAPCHAIAGDHITAGDLAAVLPAFGSVPADTVFGYAPQPGAYRSIEPAELTRFAAANSLQYHGLETICFEPALIELEPIVIEESIRESLTAMTISGAEIEVVEYSKFRVPSGKLTFPAESFPAFAPSNVAIWNGFVEHNRHRYTVWARVKITVAQTRVVTAVSLRAGQHIETGDLRLEEVRAFPVRAAGLKSVSDGAGMLARRYLNVGTTLSAADLMEPWDVDRGEMATIEVHSGGAILTLEAEAQADGRSGQSIAFRNATTGKVFRARITGRGRAMLDFHAAGV